MSGTDQGDDETVKTQDFGKNQDKNHADEKSWSGERRRQRKRSEGEVSIVGGLVRLEGAARRAIEREGGLAVAPATPTAVPARVWIEMDHSLLSGASDTGITDDANRKTSGQTGETDRETSAELDEARVERHW